jgi:hypothetical protein
MCLRVGRLAVAGAVLAGCLPASAVAGTAAVDGSRLTYRAAPGERNDVSVSQQVGVVTVQDAAGVTPGPNCRRDEGAASSVAVCDAAGVLLISLNLGAGADRARVEPVFADLVLSGGRGDDRLRADSGTVRFVGGPGDDVMFSSSGGDAVFDEGRRRNGRDTMTAATSDDPWFHPEVWVDYAGRGRPVAADLAGDRDDGERGERDLLGDGITGIQGGAADDWLIGDRGRNQLVGGPGTDLVVGGSGDDDLIATTAPQSYFPLGLVTYRGRDRLFGGPGQDLLEGSLGRNLLVPGPGPDGVWGAGGPDRVVARDRFIDVIDCGRGPDRTAEDAVDFVEHCERSSVRHRGAVPVEVSSESSHCRYGPPCPHPWSAVVVVACSRPCIGTVVLELDARAVSEGAIARRGGTWLDIPRDVFELLEQRDRRLSVTVVSGGVEVSESVANLPASAWVKPDVPDLGG